MKSRTFTTKTGQTVEVVQLWREKHEPGGAFHAVQMTFISEIPGRPQNTYVFDPQVASQIGLAMSFFGLPPEDPDVQDPALPEVDV